MKKIFYLIALAIGFGMASCSDDNEDKKSATDAVCFPLADGETSASWYSEFYNEEITYDGSGTFYDRYSNLARSGETEGRWEYDGNNKKLTYRYTFMGINCQDDWTVKSGSKYDIIMSSVNAEALKLEKIVEKHKIAVGECSLLEFGNEQYVNSYCSSNERIVSVDGNGWITATGEKGTAYIKMSGAFGNVWAKVTVGDDRKDLWCDMEPVIGMSYEQMTKHFSQFGQPKMIGGYKDFFGYALSNHDYIENIGMIVDFINDKVVQLQIKVKDGVPNSEITSYLKSRYYAKPMYNNYYTSLEKESASKLIITFDTKLRQVSFYDRAYNTAPLRDYVPMFGKSKKAVLDIMDNSGFQFLFSDYSYSKNGSDYFQSSLFGVDEKTNMVGYVYNAADVVAEVWVYKTPSASYSTFKNYFKNYYNYNSKESTSSRAVYYNDKKTVRIAVDSNSEAIIFTDLTTSIVAPKNSIGK